MTSSCREESLHVWVDVCAMLDYRGEVCQESAGICTSRDELEGRARHRSPKPTAAVRSSAQQCAAVQRSSAEPARLLKTVGFLSL